MQLRPVARPPAGLALKPLKPVAHAANKAPVPRICRSSAPLPAPGIVHVRGVGRCSSCPAPRTKARDEAEREPQQVPAAKQGEDAAAKRKAVAPRQRSMAYQLFADVYVCVYICSYRIGELIVVKTQEGLDRLRRYVGDNFNQKR